MIRLEDFGEWLDGVAERSASVSNSALLKAADILEESIKETIMGLPISTHPGVIHTGNLARSFENKNRRILISGKFTATTKVVSKLIYAAIQDVGGEILPRTRRALAIPMNRSAAIRWPRSFPRKGLGALTFLKSKKADTVGILVLKGKGKGKSKLMYVLKRKVKISKKEFTKKALRRVSGRMAEIFGDSWIKMIEAAT